MCTNLDPHNVTWLKKQHTQYWTWTRHPLHAIQVFHQLSYVYPVADDNLFAFIYLF